MVKKDKEIKVSFSVKKNGKYYAKEELSLNEFENLLVNIESNLGFEQPNYNWIDKLFGKQKMFEKKIKMIRFYRIDMCESIISNIKQTMEYDGPGKKVLKNK